MATDAYLQAQSTDSITAHDLPEAITIPALALSAAINLENAARLRAMQRTSRVLPLIAGGSADDDALPTLCEHCGERPGTAHVAPYTCRTVHICAECAALDRLIAARTGMMLSRAWLVAVKIAVTAA